MSELTQWSPYAVLVITALSAAIALCRDNLAKPGQIKVAGLNLVGAILLFLVVVGLVASVILASAEQGRTRESNQRERDAVQSKVESDKLANQRHVELVTLLAKLEAKGDIAAAKRIEQVKKEDSSIVNVTGWAYIGQFLDSKNAWLGAKLALIVGLPTPNAKYKTVSGMPLRTRGTSGAPELGNVPAGIEFIVTDVRHRTDAEVWVEVIFPRDLLKPR